MKRIIEKRKNGKVLTKAELSYLSDHLSSQDVGPGNGPSACTSSGEEAAGNGGGPLIKTRKEENESRYLQNRRN